MTKQRPNASFGPAPQGDGAPEITPVILAEAIRSSLADCYSDPYQVGLPPPETIVVNLVAGVIDRVLPDQGLKLVLGVPTSQKFG